MAEGDGLLNRYTLFWVSRVRIPSSPPVFEGSDKTRVLPPKRVHFTDTNSWPISESVNVVL